MVTWLAWLGTPFQALTAAGMWAAIGYLLLHRRGMRKLGIEAQQVQINAAEVQGEIEHRLRDQYAEAVDRYYKQVVDLRDDLQKCEDDCRRRLDVVEKANTDLRNELWGEKAQRVAEQISLINIILDTVDSPHLKTLRKTLESVQRQQTAIMPRGQEKI